jgi:hypothetical protein
MPIVGFRCGRQCKRKQTGRTPPPLSFHLCSIWQESGPVIAIPFRHSFIEPCGCLRVLKDRICIARSLGNPVEKKIVAVLENQHLVGIWVATSQRGQYRTNDSCCCRTRVNDLGEYSPRSCTFGRAGRQRCRSGITWHTRKFSVPKVDLKAIDHT